MANLQDPHLLADELSAGMLLEENEVFHSLAGVLSQVECLLIDNITSLQSDDITSLQLPADKAEIAALFQQGLFDHNWFCTYFNFDTSNEAAAIELWESSKYLRNLIVALLIGCMIDHVYKRDLSGILPAIRNTHKYNYARIHELIDEHTPEFLPWVNDGYMGMTRQITEELNSLLKHALTDVLVTIEEDTHPKHPLRAALLSLDTMVSFSNRWQLVRRPGTIRDSHDFISRGIDSMTFVPYQALVLIRELSSPEITREYLIDVYSKSFSMLALFASGDREVMGLVRRYLEKPGESVFDPNNFIIGNNGGLRPTAEALSQTTITVRRTLINLMIEGKIWKRGIPRQVTYCPAVVARRKGRKNVVRDVFDMTLELFAKLNSRYQQPSQP